VGPRASLDTEVRRKILCLCRGSNLDRPVFQALTSNISSRPNVVVECFRVWDVLGSNIGPETGYSE
jgi:hypothetical protein